MYLGLNNLGLNQSNLFSPLSLFQNGEQGALYDPSDITTLYQDSAGTTPVTAVGQLLGMVLDKRLGAVRGAELWGNGAALAFTGAASQVSSGVYRIFSPDGSLTAVSMPAATQFVAGQWYEVSFNIDSITTLGAGVMVATAGASRAATTLGPQRWLFQADATTVGLKRAGGAAIDIQVSGVSFKPIPGNHLTQPTAPARPVESGRVNKIGIATANPTSTAGITKTGDAASTLTVVNDAAAIAAAGGEIARLCTLGNVYKLDNAGGTTPAFANIGGATGNLNTHQLSGWMRSTGGPAQLGLGGTSGTSQVGAGSGYTFVTAQRIPTATTATPYVAANAGSVVYFILPEMRDVADLALSIPSTQVITGTGAGDYDTAGFPLGWDLDGVDDFLSSPTGGGGTTGFFFCAAVKVAGGAGGARVLWSDEGVNIGQMVFIDSSNRLALRVGNGAALTYASTAATLPVGETHVVTCWHDGANICSQIDNGAIASAAHGAVAAGTAGFTLGRTNGSASSHFNGRIISPIHRFGPVVSAVERAQIKRLVAAKAGIIL